MNYESRTKPELVQRAKAIGIKKYSSMKKKELIEALRSYNNPNLNNNKIRRDVLLARLLDYM